MSKDPLEMFTNEQSLTRIWRTMTAISVLLALLTIGYLVRNDPDPKFCVPRLLAAGWFLGPPLWFAFENAFLLDPSDVEQKSRRMARFRLGQDAAKMAWFGVAALIVYLTKFS